MTPPLFDLGAPTASPRARPFQTVVADCPWAPRDSLPGPKRGAASHYTTMPTGDLRALSHRFPAIADDALLFAWRLASMPYDGLDVCRAWGFEPVSEIVWVKVPVSTGAQVAKLLAKLVNGSAWNQTARFAADGSTVERVVAAARRVRIMLGHYVRCCHETCIIAARPGAAARIRAHDVPSVFFAPVGKHSEKPSAFFDLVERLAPGPYLELFGRAPRRGWTVIGDQIGSRLELPLAAGAVR